MFPLPLPFVLSLPWASTSFFVSCFHQLPAPPPPCASTPFRPRPLPPAASHPACTNTPCRRVPPLSHLWTFSSPVPVHCHYVPMDLGFFNEPVSSSFLLHLPHLPPFIFSFSSSSSAPPVGAPGNIFFKMCSDQPIPQRDFLFPPLILWLLW